MVCPIGQVTMEMIEMLVAMVVKLTEKVTHLKSVNVKLKKQISDHQGLAAGPTGPSTFGRRSKFV
jgi:hypothetical protein